MLHLISIRALIRSLIVVIALSVIFLIFSRDTNSNLFALGLAILRWSSITTMAVMLLSVAAWRWVPFVQNAIFPYLGGVWTGDLQYKRCGKTGSTSIKLRIYQNLAHVRLVMDSAESTSRTLVVYAQRDREIGRDRLYYVYLNERKEGVMGAGIAYRGLAVLRVERGTPPKLYGDYFTDQQSTGTLELSREKTNSWWRLWE